MKRSKAIKLVLVTGLLGAGSAAMAKSPDNILTSKKRFNSEIIDTNYSSIQDSSKMGSGSSSFISHIGVNRGGWGIFGHHAAC